MEQLSATFLILSFLVGLAGAISGAAVLSGVLKSKVDQNTKDIDSMKREWNEFLGIPKGSRGFVTPGECSERHRQVQEDMRSDLDAVRLQQQRNADTLNGLRDAIAYLLTKQEELSPVDVIRIIGGQGGTILMEAASGKTAQG